MKITSVWYYPVCIMLLVSIIVVTLKFMKITREVPSQLTHQASLGAVDEKIRPLLSHDGNYISYVRKALNGSRLVVRNLATHEEKIVSSPEHTSVRAYDCIWAFDNNHILYVNDDEGAIYGDDIKEGIVKAYTPYKNLNSYIRYYNDRHPYEVVIGLDKRIPNIYELYKLNVNTGDLVLLSDETDLAVTWVMDPEYTVLGKIEPLASGGSELFVRKSLNEPWRPLLKLKSVSDFAYFSKDNIHLYCFANLLDKPTREFIKLNVETGDLTVLVSDKKYDVNCLGGVFDKSDASLLGFTYMKERPEWVFFDKNLATIVHEFASTDPNGVVGVTSYTNDGTKWLLSLTKDTKPTSYWIYDTTTQQKKFLFDSN